MNNFKALYDYGGVPKKRVNELKEEAIRDEQIGDV